MSWTMTEMLFFHSSQSSTRSHLPIMGLFHLKKKHCQIPSLAWRLMAQQNPFHCETLCSCLQTIYKESLVIGIMCITFKIMPVLWVRSQVCALDLWLGPYLTSCTDPSVHLRSAWVLYCLSTTAKRYHVKSCNSAEIITESISNWWMCSSVFWGWIWVWVCVRYGEVFSPQMSVQCQAVFSLCPPVATEILLPLFITL